MRKRVLVLAALVVGTIALVGAPVLAFHDDGVADCAGCHTMHNSEDGAARNFNAAGTGPGTAVGTGYEDLLLFPNKSDVCLRCHARDGGYGVWASDPLSPGADHGAGNFVFLEEDNINDGHGGGSGTCSADACGVGGTDPCTNETDCVAAGENWTWTNAIPGYSAGHSIKSGIKNTDFDGILTAAPGGSFPYDELYCSSCHDPHGTDAYRLTYKAGQEITLSDASTFTYPAGATIDGTAIAVFGPGESNTYHNAYRSGYSQWCGACHGDFHNQGGSSELIHPSGQLLDTRQIASYNQYRGSTDCAAKDPTGPSDVCGDGSAADAYLYLVPFEDAANASIASTAGPTATSRVACVSCHRAHASSAPNAGRWDFNVTGLAEDGHESGSYTLPNPYDANQRSLCNKCHAQDEYDAVVDFTP